MKKITALLLALIIMIGFTTLFSIESLAAFSGADKINIVLDPGHGGSNVGASANGRGENYYAMLLAEYIRTELQNNGSFNVYFTRTGNYDLELYERAEVANYYNADLVISLHFDGSPDRSMRGTTAYTSVLPAYALTSLASSMTAGISSATGLSNNGVRQRQDNQGYYWNHEKQWDCQDASLGTLSDYYGIPTWCAKFGIPSIIIEHGYFSNSADVSLIFAEGALERMAKAEATAIINYFTNHTHVYGAQKQDYASNCVYTGKSSTHCSYCGHRINVTSLSPNTSNHYWVRKESSPAACGRDGKVVWECRITQNLKDKGWEGAIHTETEIIPAPQDHTFSLIADVAPTHTVDGYQTYKCNTCSYSFKEVLKAEGHSYEFQSYKEPTCTKTGGNSYKCTVCGHRYTDVEAAKGHSFEILKKVDPTCTEEGYQDKKCTVCDHEARDIFPPLDHALPPECIRSATCTEDGYRKGTCLRCGKEIDESVKSTGHDLAAASQSAPTCTEEGTTLYTCSRCEYSETATEAATGHSFEKEITKKATCTKNGEETSTCTLCGAVETSVIEKTGHKKSADGKTTKKAGLFTKGEIQFSCKNGCDKIYTAAVPSLFMQNIKAIILSISALLFLAALTLAALIILQKRKESKNAHSDTMPTESAPEKESAEETVEECATEPDEKDDTVKEEEKKTEAVK